MYFFPLPRIPLLLVLATVPVLSRPAAHGAPLADVIFLGTSPETVSSSPVPPENLSSFGADSAGRFFYADQSHGRILRVDNHGQRVLLGNLTQFDIAVGWQGRITVADTTNNRILELDGGSNAPLAHVRGRPFMPRSVAVDGSGRVFVISGQTIEEVGDNGRIVPLEHIPAAERLATGPVTNGVSSLYVLTAEPGGKSAILVYKYQGDHGWLETVTDGTWGHASGFAVDASGNALLAYEDTNDNTEVAAIHPDGFTAPLATASIVAPDTPLSMDSNRNLYFLSSSGVQKVQLGAPSFGPVEVGVDSQSPQLTLNVAVGAGESITAAHILQDRRLDLSDFQIVPTACSPGPGGHLSICTIQVLFMPGTLAGPESAEALLQNASGESVLSIPIYAVPIGPDFQAYTCNEAHQAVFSRPGLDGPTSLVVDVYGDLYSTNEAAGTVVEAAINNTGQFEVNTLRGGLKQPHALAVDGAGDLYIAQEGAPGILRRDIAGRETLLAPDLKNIASLTFDPLGNLYIAAQSTIYRLGQDGAVVSFANPETDGHYANAFSLATDIHGNVFAGFGAGGPAGKGGIVRFSPAGQPGRIYAFVERASGLALDAAGSLYITDPLRHTLSVLFRNGRQVTLLSGLAKPVAVAYTQYGIYVADEKDSSIFTPVIPSSYFNFGNVPVGSSRTSRIILASVGTDVFEPDFFNYSGSPGFLLPVPSLNLAPGTYNYLTVVFAPQTPGSYSVSVGMISNRLNIPDGGLIVWDYSGVGMTPK